MMKLFIIPFVLFSLDLMAEEITLPQLESQLEQRVSPLVKAFDQNGRVVVKVSVNSTKVVLPGLSNTEVDVNGSAMLRGVGTEDVSGINVTVISKQAVIPEWLNTQIKQVLSFKNVVTNVDLQKVDPRELADTSESAADNSTAVKVESVLDRFGKKAMIFFGSVFVYASFMAILYMLIFPRAINKAATKISDGIKSTSEQSKTRQGASRTNDSIKPVSATPEPNNQTDTVSSLALTSVKALFTDCYWSNEDSYGAWLWAKLSREQKEHLLTEVPFAYAYSNYLSDIQAEYKTFHLHPYYLNPMSLELISNADFEKWVNSLKSSPKRYSPIRQTNIRIPLKKRLEMTSGNGIELPLPQASKVTRQLPVRSSDVELSTEDEVYLMDNYKSVSDDMKQHMPSLVWLWALDQKTKESVLSKYSADELAQAWIGPEKVLADLTKLMPEVKQKLLKEITSKTPPSRKSKVLKDISAASFRPNPSIKAVA